jgi:hypothetical protein
MTPNHPQDPTKPYAPDGSHLEPQAALWEELEKRSLEQLANLTLGLPLPGDRLQFHFLNEDICVDLRNRHLTRVRGRDNLPLADPLLELVTLAYLNRVQSILPLDRDIVGVSDLKEAHFFTGPHALRTEAVVERFGRHPAGFQRAVLSLEGRLVDMADGAGRLLPFPRIPLYFLIWFADAEFPARLRVLFDRSIESFLPADAIWALVNRVAQALVDETAFPA